MSDTYSSDAVTFSDTTWKHIAVTLDSVEKKMTFYENGVAVGTRVMTNAFIPNISGINIGARSNATDGATNFFDGELDNVMIHNRVLDLDEIKMLSETKFPAIQNADSWVHVGASYDKSTGDVAIYKNGAKVGTATGQSITLPENANDLKVGTNLKGKMDNFALFERKISDDEFKVLGNIKRYEGQFYNQETIINCNFNNVLSISNNFRGQYFMFEYIQNHGGSSNTLNDVDFYISDVPNSVYEKNVRDLTTAKLYHLSEISNITKIQVKNVDSNNAIKVAALYYSETLPSGKTVDNVTISEFKDHAIFAQNFHLEKGAPTDNQVSENIAVNVTGNGIHGIFASPPVRSSDNHYGGTYNKSAAIGGNPDNHLKFSGNAFANSDFSESYMSAWINTPTLVNDFYIFKKDGEFAFKCAKTTNYLCADIGSTSVTSTLTVTPGEWTNIGVHFNKQNGKITFFKKSLSATGSEVDIKTDQTLSVTANTNDIKTYIETTTPVSSTPATHAWALTLDAGQYKFTQGSNSYLQGHNFVINVGDTMEFTLSGVSAHPFNLNTTNTIGTASQISGVTNNGASTDGTTVSYTFATEGTFYYNCQNHAAMNGKIIVTNLSNTVYVDNLRVDLGYFNGTDKFIEFADTNNEVSIPTITNDTWTHVAATYESAKGRVKMYHDGVQVAEFNNYNVVPTNDSNQPVFIGKYGDTVISDNVMLSDVKVYDKVLNDKQISDLYAA